MKKLINYYVNDTRTIKDAMTVIQSNLSRCVIVVNDGNKVVGVVSEGDILRAILSGISIGSPLRPVINTSFCYLKENNMEEAYVLMKRLGPTLIPVIDQDFMLKDVITSFDIMEHLVLIKGKQ